MKKMNKKGFTIVELVIVIAVIAIMSAVLIPTFSGIIKKSKRSADQQAVANMNKILSTEVDAPANIQGVIEILLENDYAGDLTTYYKNNKLAWIASENVIVLVENDKIVYPEAYAGKTATYTLINPIAADSKEVISSLKDSGSVVLNKDVNLSNNLSTTDAKDDYEIKLDGKTLTTTARVESTIEGAKMVLSGGNIDATNSNSNAAVYAYGGGVLEVSNVSIYAAAGKNPLQCYGGTMVLDNVTTAQYGEAEVAWYNSAIQVINTIQQVEGKWTMYGPQANLTVNSGMYSAKLAIQISAPGGNVTINGGTFIGTEYVINADFAPQNYGNSAGYESVITINGGNFTGNLKISVATVLVINGGTFSTDVVKVGNTNKSLSEFLGTGKTLVDNGNGTWTVA